jgi:methylmalonyl-CoA mutase cobalamin-binding domain/chain
VRTPTNRRLYSDADVERLEMLSRATAAGHSIGAIAGLQTGELARISSALATVTPEVQGLGRDAYVQGCIDATMRLDAQKFEKTLEEGLVSLGQHGLLEQVVAPVAEAIGDLWREGTITAAHEHFASAAIRVFLGNAARNFALPSNAPHLVVATPAGQLHELGAVMVAAAAADVGWRVTYLGTSLPAAEIAASAMQNKAQGVALSIVYPADDEHLPSELEKLRRYLPPETKLFVGGRASASYADAISRIGAMHAHTLSEFCTQLDGVRVNGRRA